MGLGLGLELGSGLGLGLGLRRRQQCVGEGGDSRPAQHRRGKAGVLVARAAPVWVDRTCQGAGARGPRSTVGGSELDFKLGVRVQVRVSVGVKVTAGVGARVRVEEEAARRRRRGRGERRRRGGAIGRARSMESVW